MPESFIPYGRQTVTESDIAAVESVLRGPMLTQGPVVSTFERAVADKVNALYGVAVNSATSALHIACQALGLGPSDYLWTSPITFVASANCGRYCGAQIDFVDIDSETGLMSVEALEKKLSVAEREGKLPKIVVPVHLTGSSCDMEAIGSLAKRYNFAVIEDASHAIGARYQDKPVGNCHHSSITVFSFHPVKIITTGEGGLATTNDPKLARKMKELRSHGIVKDEERFVQPAAGPWIYEQQDLGYNYRITDIQAALGLNQLKRLDEIVKERNRQYQYYMSLLKHEPIKLLQIPDSVYSSVHLVVILLEGKTIRQHRQLFEELRKKGVGVQLHYSPVHLQPYYRKHGFLEGQFPEAENYARSAMSLPVFPGLSSDEQNKVSSTLVELLKKI